MSGFYDPPTENPADTCLGTTGDAHAERMLDLKDQRIRLLQEQVAHLSRRNLELQERIRTILTLDPMPDPDPPAPPPDLPPQPKAPLHPMRLIEIVAVQFGITLEDMVGPRRTAAVSRARQLAMELLRDLTRLSLGEVGRILGGRDHTTVLHGVEQTRARLLTDPMLVDSRGAIIATLERERILR